MQSNEHKISLVYCSERWLQCNNIITSSINQYYCHITWVSPHYNHCTIFIENIVQQYTGHTGNWVVTCFIKVMLKSQHLIFLYEEFTKDLEVLAAFTWSVLVISFIFSICIFDMIHVWKWPPPFYFSIILLTMQIFHKIEWNLWKVS